MKCPTCVTDLVMADRQGVEIDYCPQCRGVWLDRGELDKIIERSTDSDSRRYDNRKDDDRRYEDKSHYSSESAYHHKKKRKGFLGEIFDF